MKVAGAQRPIVDMKGKGKAPDAVKKSLKRVAVTDLASGQAKKARGRSIGAANYKDEDLDALMDVAEVVIPVGKRGWNMVAVDFAEWVKETGRPERSADSLEKKFKQVVRMEKPTGQADCPPWLDRAHAIYSLMDEKVTTRNVDDDDIADEPLELSSSDELEEELTMELLTRKPRGRLPQSRSRRNPPLPPSQCLTVPKQPCSHTRQSGMPATSFSEASRMCLIPMCILPWRRSGRHVPFSRHRSSV